MTPTTLSKELGCAPPKRLVSQLTDEEAERLATALSEARRRQSAALAAAADGAFNHVPRLLRGPVRKILGA